MRLVDTPAPVMSHDHEDIITLSRTQSEISLLKFEDKITEDQQKEFLVKVSYLLLEKSLAESRPF